MSASWPGGNTHHWRFTVRPAVLRRDGQRCRVADFKAGRYSHPQLADAEAYRATLRVSPKCTGARPEGLTGHHIRGRRVTGDDPRWIIACCQPCNNANGDPAAGDPEPRLVTKW